MPIRNSSPISFLPTGITDCVDQTSAFPGACQIISNLVFDRANRGAMIVRPGAGEETNFPPFASPGIVSAMFTAGTLIYGLVASNRNLGFDEPFCYDTVAQSFITVSGITGTNCPVSQVPTGAWTPPTMDAMGIYIGVTHPGFAFGNLFGWFDVTNPAAPVWNAGNTTVNLLPSKPTWIAQFYGRFYFGIGNVVYFTDSLTLAISNPNFASALSLGDISASTGAAGLPMSQTSGGVLQSLIVFKQSSVWQISGDIALTNAPLMLSKIADNTGCVAPRTIQSTPYGIIYIATDGPRIVNLSGAVAYLQGKQAGPSDIVGPFETVTNPSRMVGCYADSVYRVCFEGNIEIWDSPFSIQDYWYDFQEGRWTGPHTFLYHTACSVQGTFYLASNLYPGYMINNQPSPRPNSVYTDLGMTYVCELVSTALEGAPMSMSAVVESTIELCGAGVGNSYYISMYDDENNALSPATIKMYDINPLWGQNKWGQFHWRSSTTNSQVFTIPWVNPVVFKKMIFSVRVNAAQNVSVRTISMRVQQLGYMNA